MNDNDSARMRAKANNIAVLRTVVAGYLTYLGGSLVWDRLQGESTLAPAMAWGLGLLFVAAGLGFGLYTWKRWQADAKVAEKAAAEAQDGPEEPPEDDEGAR